MIGGEKPEIMLLHEFAFLYSQPSRLIYIYISRSYGEPYFSVCLHICFLLSQTEISYRLVTQSYTLGKKMVCRQDDKVKAV